MVLFKDIEVLENGARFLNVDLHIHSYGASPDVKDATMTPQAIVDSAVAQGLSVIAITDHNSDKNVYAALEHAQQYAGRLLVLPGVEVTTAPRPPSRVLHPRAHRRPVQVSLAARLERRNGSRKYSHGQVYGRRYRRGRATWRYLRGGTY